MFKTIPSTEISNKVFRNHDTYINQSYEIISQSFRHIMDVVSPLKPNCQIELYNPNGVEVKEDYWLNFASVTSTIANVMVLNKLVKKSIDDSRTETIQFFTSLFLITINFPSKTINYTNDHFNINTSCFKPIISDFPFRFLFLVYPWISQSIAESGYPGIETPEIPFCGPAECNDQQDNARNYWWLDFFFGALMFTINRFQFCSKQAMNQRLMMDFDNNNLNLDDFPKVYGDVVTKWDVFRITNAVNAGLISIFYLFYQLFDVDNSNGENEKFFKDCGTRYFAALFYLIVSPLMVHYTFFPKPDTRFIVSEFTKHPMQYFSSYHHVHSQSIPLYELISKIPDLRSILVTTNVIVFLLTLTIDQALQLNLSFQPHFSVDIAHWNQS